MKFKLKVSNEQIKEQIQTSKVLLLIMYVTFFIGVLGIIKSNSIQDMFLFSMYSLYSISMCVIFAIKSYNYENRYIMLNLKEIQKKRKELKK